MPNYFYKCFFRLNEYAKLNSIDINQRRRDNGLYDIDAEQTVKLSDMPCPTTIRCTLSLHGTNYTSRIEAIFYGKKTTKTFVLFYLILIFILNLIALFINDGWYIL